MHWRSSGEEGGYLEDAGEGRAQGAVGIAGEAGKEDTPERELVQWHSLVLGQQLKVPFQQGLQAA